MYLDTALPPRSLRHSVKIHGAALHPDRNLAVSPPRRRGIRLMEAPFPLGSGVTARIPRLSADGCYPLPCSARTRAGVSGLSSREAKRSGAITLLGHPALYTLRRKKTTARLIHRPHPFHTSPNPLNPRTPPYNTYMEFPNETYANPLLAPPEKQAPHDAVIEQSLLGALLWNADRFHDVAEIVETDAFYTPRNRLIFEAMTAIAGQGESIDSVTVMNRLAVSSALESVGGREYLQELVEQSPSVAHLESYAKIIQDSYTRRRLQNAGTAIVKISTEGLKDVDQVIDESEKELFEITQHHTHARYREIATVIPDLVNEIITVSENGNQHRGIPTGYTGIDNALSGLHASDLVILAARPSVGKTTLALDMARQSALKHGTAVGIFSLEMSTSQLIERLLSTESRLDAWRMRTGKIKSAEDFNVLNEAADRLRKLPIYIDDRSSMSTLNIRSTARRMKREHDIKIIIVDYLQLITPHESRKSDSIVQHITEVSRTLKQIARELSVPVLALSQLSRDIEKRAGKPRLSDLRDSGSIEQDADVVMFLHRNTDQMYEGDEHAPIPTDLMIEKHRNGPTGRVALQFDKRYATFVEPASEEYNQQATQMTDVPF